MNELKYIIVIPRGFNLIMGARAILFNGMVTHSDMVPEDMEVHSAGFMTLEVDTIHPFDNLKIKCYGESVSLKVQSDPAIDRVIIERTLTRNHPSFGYIKEEEE